LVLYFIEGITVLSRVSIAMSDLRRGGMVAISKAVEEHMLSIFSLIAAKTAEPHFSRDNVMISILILKGLNCLIMAAQ
jgi:hypothetical protein